MKKTIIPRNDPARVFWFGAFAKGLLKYAEKYGISKAETDAVTAMALFSRTG